MMIQDSNIFTKKIKSIQQTQQQITSLDSIIKNSKAIHLYYRTMLLKFFECLKPNSQLRHFYLTCYFNRFIEGFYSSKSERISKILQKRFYSRIQEKVHSIKLKRNRLSQIKLKMLSAKNKMVFHQWKVITQIQIISKIFTQKKKSENFKEFIELLRENHRLSSITKLQLQTKNSNTTKLYRIKLLYRSFQSFKMNTKIQKLTQFLISNYLKEFVLNSRKCSSTDQALVYRFQRKSLLKRSFYGWKQIYQQQMATSFNNALLLEKYFIQWKQNLIYIASEKQIDCNNERIIDISLDRIERKTLQRVFKAWKQQVQQMKENRHRNSIINAYAEKQKKYTLLKKYFQKLRLNCINNQVKLKYRNTKLKRKAFDSFKMDLQSSVINQQKVIKFIQKKYFKKIKLFNEIEDKRITKHRLHRFFILFTNSIISQYCQLQDSARAFYQTNLLYKSIFSIKLQRTKRLKQEYVIGLVNVIIPMRRWFRYHKITKYIHQKQWFFMKSIFREWRIQVVRKYSQKKLIKEFSVQQSADKSNNNNESKLQMFQFQNIMATIAKIRNNINAQKKQTLKKREQNIQGNQQIQLHTPSQSINFSYSLETI